jgi:hypothetical protein
MGPMRGALAIAILAVLAVPGTAPSATKPPATKTHTAHGMAQARSLLLTARDLAPSWTAQPAPKPVPSLSCAGRAPSTTGVVETGSAASPRFGAGPTGPFAAQTVYVYANARQASTYWRRAVGDRIGRCLSEAVVKGSTDAIRFTVSKVERLPALRVVGVSALFRVSAEVASAGQTVPAYVDIVLIQNRNAITALTFSSLSEPVGSTLRLRLSQRLANRLAAA